MEELVSELAKRGELRLLKYKNKFTRIPKEKLVLLMRSHFPEFWNIRQAKERQRKDLRVTGKGGQSEWDAARYICLHV